MQQKLMVIPRERNRQSSRKTGCLCCAVGADNRQSECILKITGKFSTQPMMQTHKMAKMLHLVAIYALTKNRVPRTLIVFRKIKQTPQVITSGNRQVCLFVDDQFPEHF